MLFLLPQTGAKKDAHQNGVICGDFLFCL